jgi:hypothetical protein
VLMPAAEGETQPELLKLMRAGSLPGELKQHTNEARLHGLVDGQIPPAIAGSDPQGEVYRELVLASSRSYRQLLPTLFEGLDDASELLLPDDLLSDGSIAGSFRSQISDSDCEDVEIIGWLYQFYISEKKDQVIGKVYPFRGRYALPRKCTPERASLSGQRSRAAVAAELRDPAAMRASLRPGDGRSRPAPGTARYPVPVAARWW